MWDSIGIKQDFCFTWIPFNENSPTIFREMQVDEYTVSMANQKQYAEDNSDFLNVLQVGIKF